MTNFVSRNSSKLTVCALLAVLTYAGPVYAYLDPGTGSIILQGLIAGVAGLLVVLKLYWARLKSFFSSTAFTTKKTPNGNSEADNAELDKKSEP